MTLVRYKRKKFQAILVNFHQCSDITYYSSLIFCFHWKAYEILGSYNQFASGWVKKVKIKLFLNYLMKLPWLLDGSVYNVFPSPFHCSILIKCTAFIALAKIPEREVAIARQLIASVNPIYLVDEFHSLFLLFIPLRTTQQRWAGWRDLVCEWSVRL